MPYIHENDRVQLKRDIFRVDQQKNISVLYAKQGEIGVVQEIFRPHEVSFGQPKQLCAKVLISNKIKTFRLTSLEVVGV